MKNYSHFDRNPVYWVNGLILSVFLLASSATSAQSAISQLKENGEKKRILRLRWPNPSNSPKRRWFK